MGKFSENSYQKLLKTSERLDNCGKFYTVKKTCLNQECGYSEESILKTNCFLRFSSCCYDIRYKRALSRLNSYKIRSSRLIHLVIGFPTKENFHRNDKKTEERVMQLFTRELKKFGIFLSGLRIFDFQETDLEFTHYHYALLPLKNLSIHTIQHVRNDVIQKTKKQFVVKILGYRERKGLFKYFSKRIAGKYGDYPNEFFLENKMDLETYLENFYGVRSLVKISRRLSCSFVPVSLSCIVCGCQVSLRFTEIPIEYLQLTLNDTIPPPKTKKGVEKV